MFSTKNIDLASIGNGESVVQALVCSLFPTRAEGDTLRRSYSLKNGLDCKPHATMRNCDSQIICHGLSIDISNSLVGALIPHGLCLTNERCCAPPLSIS
jgi:hypothetical protein